MAGQDVEEMVDLIFVEHSDLCGALRALDWVVNLVVVHPRWCLVRNLVLCGFLLSPPPLPIPLFPLLLRFVAQHLVSLHCTVHNEHGSVLRPVLFMPGQT